ncbi:MAG: yehZ [Clostridiales bacterium]|jgi:osmoprotectant transport system substrate-binding protein|nr:yehZ [Clostridiales bacterium]
MKIFKRSFFLKGILMVLVLTFVIGAVVGCSGSSGKATIKVGSKEFTEQLILGQITLLALEDAGFDVKDKTNIAGSTKVRNALANGDFDLYWEYTGTAWLVHLQHDQAITDSQKAYDKVKAEDKKNGFIWLDYAPFNNTYTLMMRKDHADKLGIKSISDLADYINSNPGELTVGIDHEFSVRPDGFPGLEKKYGFELAEDNIKIMDLGITYKTLRDGQVDVAMGFATDGRIAAFNLVNLEDNKKFFPVYNPAPVVRQEVLDKNPKIADVLNKIAAKLDTKTMTNLNYQVDIKEREPRAVAEEWLKSEGLID